MSEPIISPWVIYIGGILPFVNFICVVSILVFSSGLFVSCIEESLALYKKYMLIGLLSSLFIGIFVPPQKTYYAMVVANYVTQENINIAKDITFNNIEVILNKIIETAEKIKEK